MLRDIAVTRIQDGLGFRTDMADKIVLRMQEEQRDLERGKTLPSFMSVESPLTLTTGQRAVSLPVDFLRISGENMEYNDTTTTNPRWKRIPWRYFENFFFPTSTAVASGAPNTAFLNLTAGNILFDNYADIDYTIYLIYFAKGDILDANIENVWLANAPELIIGGAGRRIAADLRNKTAFELFDAMWKQTRATWFSEAVIEATDEAGPLVIGANN